jgi:translation initiation factor IF-2
VLEQFYENIPHVGVSAATGEGMEELFVKLKNSRQEYEEMYVPYLEERKKARQFAADEKKVSELEKLQHDIKNASIFS